MLSRGEDADPEGNGSAPLPARRAARAEMGSPRGVAGAQAHAALEVHGVAGGYDRGHSLSEKHKAIGDHGADRGDGIRKSATSGDGAGRNPRLRALHAGKTNELEDDEERE